ncbi:hypothetical protein AMS68_000220 [Peltaster fructicola]|uniref:Plus3 domain-containing protein n=1 Tax=Peltaster fructicola TaxID=286661 RepID=A0A6H0XJ00_9PEZI|nr:hypothetical protein AMS68_000220 [Peltaster fructicola]
MSFSDNEDDALLALAGDDDDDDVGSGEEGELDETQAISERAPSTDGDVQPSVEKVEDSGPRRGVAQKVRAKRGRARRRRDDSEDEEDEEDNEILSSSPYSSMDQRRQTSASAEAAGTPLSTQDAVIPPIYPIEGKFVSQADKSWLLSLPELEREQELNKRAQEVIRAQQDMQLKRALATGRATKRKADDADLEDSATKSSRPKMERGAKSALDKYKKMREQAGVVRERRDERRAARRDERSPTGEGSERDADGESEVEYAEPTSRRGEEPLADLTDFNHCRLGRSNFAQICFYPGFEEAITGCYARVNVGSNRDTGENMYRLALIKGFKEGKPYQLENSNGKKFLTDQYAIVAQGKSEKTWPFAACSDSKATSSEVTRYLDMLKEQRVRLPTRKALNTKLDQIHALLNRKWTDEDISSKINKQKAIEKKYDPANAANLAREKILKRKQAAEEDEDFDEIATCNAELQALEANSNGNALGRAPIAVKALKATTEQDRLAARNALTRKTNSEEVRKALLEERRREIAHREKVIAEAKAKAAAEAEAKSKLQVPDADLFGSDVSRAGTPSSSVKKLKTANGVRSSSQNGIKRPIGALRTEHKNDDDVIAAMDLGIDIEI